MPKIKNQLDTPEKCALWVAKTGIPLMLKDPDLGQLHFVREDRALEFQANNPTAEPLEYAEIDGYQNVYAFRVEV